MMAGQKKRAKKTPVRRALKDDWSLQADVKNGLAAVESAHRGYLATGIRSAFADSLDLDTALQESYPGENRWDYLLGHSASEEVIGLEPHSAKEDQVSTLIKKRKAAKQQLASHLRTGKSVARWLWVASGKVQFADTEKTRRLLDQNGIEFVGKQVQPKHLSGALGAGSGRRK